MQKEIKLKFKDLQHKERQMFTSDDCDSYELGDLIKNERFLKMEYVQRKDVHEADIFDGDILSSVKSDDTNITVGSPKIVFWNQERLAFYWRKQDDPIGSPFWEYDITKVKYKIIGNVNDDTQIVTDSAK